MLLLIDIGNTSTKTGFHEHGSFKQVLTVATETLNDADRFASRIERFIRAHRLDAPAGCVICSVVPRLGGRVDGSVRRVFGIKPLQVTHRTRTGARYPEWFGADRIANAAAVRHLFREDAIVLTFGTATTVSVITSKGEYKGGAIMPGIGLLASSLAEGTAKLPKADLGHKFTILGRSTEDNILTGILMGHAGAVERIIQEIGNKYKTLNPLIIATGGFADLMLKYTDIIGHVDQLLTLNGLRIIYELNTCKKDNSLKRQNKGGH